MPRFGIAGAAWTAAASCSAFPAKGSNLKLGTTIDQIIAKEIGSNSTFPSMEFATEDHSSHLGSCAGDFLCSYMSTISWASASQPLPMEINPRVVFERMFGDGGSTEPAARLARIRRDRSILDSLDEAVADLQRGLGVSDRDRLGEYLDSVRDIERIGDYAKNIAKRAIVLSTHAPLKPVASIPRMSQLALQIIKDVLDAYVELNAAKAVAAWQRDEEVDEMYTSLFRELLTYMMEDQRNIGPSIHLLFIAKNIERIGDHATNIAEDVIFMVLAKDIRHHAEESAPPA